MPFHNRRVLVLDGHTNQALACARSLGRGGATVFIASPTRRPLAAWSRYCRDSFHQSGDSVAALAEVRDWARVQGVQVVLPQRERTCLMLNTERHEWERWGMRLGCGPTDLLLRAFDKASTLRFAQACGVRIPPTGFPTSFAEAREAAAAVGYPCIVKPRLSDYWDGNHYVAAHGAEYVQNEADLEATVLACRQGTLWPLIQGVVGGRGKGVFALYDRGTPIVWFAHERLRDIRPSGSGSSLRRSIPVEPRLREPSMRLLAAMGWHGPAMVEFRDDGEGEPCLMEVNGRFWSSLALAVAAGVDFPAMWTALIGNMPVAAPVDYKSGVTLRWLWGDVKRALFILDGPPPGCPVPYPSWAKGFWEILGPQPRGTRSEMWSWNDPWPSVGEWVQGAAELGRVVRERLWHRRAPATQRALLTSAPVAAPMPAPAPASPPPSQVSETVMAVQA